MCRLCPWPEGAHHLCKSPSGAGEQVTGGGGHLGIAGPEAALLPVAFHPVASCGPRSEQHVVTAHTVSKAGTLVRILVSNNSEWWQHDGG